VKRLTAGGLGIDLWAVPLYQKRIAAPVFEARLKMFDTKRLALLPLAALALLTACQPAYEEEIGPNPVYEDQCSQQGWDPGTTEFVNCVNELSKGD